MNREVYGVWKFPVCVAGFASLPNARAATRITAEMPERQCRRFHPAFPGRRLDQVGCGRRDGEVVQTIADLAGMKDPQDGGLMLDHTAIN